MIPAIGAAIVTGANEKKKVVRSQEKMEFTLLEWPWSFSGNQKPGVSGVTFKIHRPLFSS